MERGLAEIHRQVPGPIITESPARMTIKSLKRPFDVFVFHDAESSSNVNNLFRSPEALLANHLDQHSFGTSAVEFIVEDLLLGPKVELSIRNRDHDLPPHDLAFQMSVGVIFARPIMRISLRRCIKSGEVFQPLLIILVQSGLIVVDEDRSRNVHRIAKEKTFFDATLPDNVFHLGCDVQKSHSSGNVEGQVFGM
jgi:hypothetical protein